MYTTFIITVLTLSILVAAIPMASALSTKPGLYATPSPASGTPITAKAVGNVGDKISVVGNSTHGISTPFSTVTAYWDSLAGKVLGSTSADVSGNYRIDVIIPSAKNGTHYIVVNDGAGAQGAKFEVTPSLQASATRALPGDSVVITGHGFAASSAITVTLNSTTLGTPVGITITSPAITSNATGSFSATIVIPTVAVANYNTYSLNGTDAALNMAVTSLIINYYITLTPSTGPTGITTTIAGRIEANTAYELRFNGAAITTGTSGSDGSYSYGYTIPGVLSAGPYAVDIVWATTNTRTATFTVTTAPTISLGAATGVAGAVVTITGSGFSGKANITLYFGTVVVNSTTMNANFGPTTTSGALPSGLKFVVPTLTPGVYAVKVVDQYGATSAAGVFFTITPTPVTTIVLRGTSYYPGDTLSFNFVSTDAIIAGPNCTIRDPTGAIWWTAIWGTTTTGPVTTVQYQWQLFGVDEHALLPADAPLGSWNWTITYTPSSTGTATKATGLFTVVALPTMQTVLDKLDGLNANITSIATTAKGDIIAVINTKTGTITTKLDPLMPKLQGIEDTAVIIATMLGEVQVDIAALDLDAMGVDITAIKGDVATIKSNIGTVTTNVATLDAKVVALSGDVATVSTTLGTLEGTVTAIDGKVATVNTNVGTIKADVSDIKAKPDVDMTPVWIAVVLSLIAAIAAIFAVVTIRQKIAG